MTLELKHCAVVGDVLALAFTNGNEIFLPLGMLRRACPCAICQGEPDALGRVVRPSVVHGPESFLLSRFERLGSYAMQFYWQDGHHSGIYSFEYLLKLSQTP